MHDTLVRHQIAADDELHDLETDLNKARDASTKRVERGRIRQEEQRQMAIIDRKDKAERERQAAQLNEEIDESRRTGSATTVSWSTKKGPFALSSRITSPMEMVIASDTACGLP